MLDSFDTWFIPFYFNPSQVLLWPQIPRWCGSKDLQQCPRRKPGLSGHHIKTTSYRGMGMMLKWSASSIKSVLLGLSLGKHVGQPVRNVQATCDNLFDKGWFWLFIYKILTGVAARFASVLCYHYFKYFDSMAFSVGLAPYLQQAECSFLTWRHRDIDWCSVISSSDKSIIPQMQVLIKK